MNTAGHEQLSKREPRADDFELVDRAFDAAKAALAGCMIGAVISLVLNGPLLLIAAPSSGAAIGGALGWWRFGRNAARSSD